MKIPKSEMDTKQICDDLVFGMGRVYILKTAIQLNILGQLKEGAAKTASEVARALGTHEVLTEKFLNALAAMKYLEKRDGKFNLALISETFLVPEEPLYYGDAAMMFSEGLSLMTNLAKILKEGPSSSPMGMEMMLGKTMIRALGMYVLANELPATLEIVTSLPEFGNAKKMLDIGGLGYFSLGLCSSNPELKAVVFDLPTVTPFIKEIISQYEGEGQVETMAGDISSSTIGEGYDLILASSVFSVFYQYPDRLEELFKKICDALNPGGVFVFNHFTLIKEETEPLVPVISQLVSATMGMAHALSEVAVLSALQGAEYTNIEKKWVNGGPGPRYVFVARKGEGGDTNAH